MEVLRSKKGRDLIGYNGNIYRKDRDSATRITWRCRKTKCKGRLSTRNPPIEGEDAVEVGEYAHAPEPAEVEVERLRTKVIQGASTNHDPPRRVLQEALVASQCGTEAMARVGSGTKYKRTVTRKRKHDEDHPPNPRNPVDINFPAALRRTYTDEDL